MLTVLAYSLVIVFMYLIMTKQLPALTALILVPIAFTVLGGFGQELGPMMLTGIKNLAPTGVMLMFAILYFGIMIDAGDFCANDSGNGNQCAVGAARRLNARQERARTTGDDQPARRGRIGG